MFLSYLVLFIAITLSTIAAWYSIIGLTAIFAAAVVPIIIMGGALEVAKVVITVWLHQYWRWCKNAMKTYLVFAVFFLMLLTSMGIFGFLSKAHLDQAVPSGDIQAKLNLVDEKIKTQRDNIETARKALRQLDESVDQTMSRTTDEKGADKAAALRRSQARERNILQNDIAKAQTEIARLNEERAPIASEVRKVEAEVGPIKYIAALIYGDNPDQGLLEKAVRWVIIIIVAVFDPLAIMMVLAATESMEWHKRGLIPRYKNGHVLDVVQDPIKEKTWYEYKPFNLITDLAKNIAGLVGSFRSRFKRKTPLSESIANDGGTNGNGGDLQSSAEPMDQSIQSVGGDHAAPAESRKNYIVDYKVLEDVDDEDPEIEKKPSKPDAAISPRKNENVDLDSEYITYSGKLWRREALMSKHPELWLKKLQKQEDGIDDQSKVSFGVDWPKSPDKGDQFLRVDFLPTKLFKYNGQQWIEIDKNNTDTYSYDKSYIEYLIEKISTGEYDPDLLSDGEREQLQNILERDVALKK